MAASEAVSLFDRVEAVLRNEAIYELAKLIPEHEEGDAGRPRDFPDYMLFVFDALISVYGSARKVEAELANRNVWHFVRRLVKKIHKNQPEMHLPPYRYRRYHYEYGRNCYLANPVMIEQMQEVHRRLAAEQARELGLLDPEGDGSFTHPSLDRLLYADGKVVAPLYKAEPGMTRVNKETGEIRPVRYEADADLHFQGDGEAAWGVKFVMTAVRTNDVHGRIILDARHCPEKGGEAKFAMNALRDIAPHTPGAQGVIYDTALRGKHHVQIMRDLGWLSINRVAAAEIRARANQKGKRVEKNVHIEDKVVNGKTIRLFARGGAVCTAELDQNGEQILTELERSKTIRRTNADGTYRFYNQYRLPDGELVMVRLDTTEQDEARKLNRSENVRQIPPTDVDFKRLYGRRSDAESINRVLDDSMWLGRAHSKGALRQTVNMLGFALMINGIALLLNRKRRAASPETNRQPAEGPPVGR